MITLTGNLSIDPNEITLAGLKVTRDGDAQSEKLYTVLLEIVRALQASAVVTMEAGND